MPPNRADISSLEISRLAAIVTNETLLPVTGVERDGELASNVRCEVKPMKNSFDEFLAAWGVALAGCVMWSLLLAYLATKQLQPML